MNKYEFFLILIVSILLGYVISLFVPSFVNKNTNIVDNQYENETVERCLSFEEYEKNPDAYGEPDCLSSFTVFSPHQVDIALNYSKKLKYAYRKQDINMLANTLVYPINIYNYNNDGKTIVINTPQELLKLDKNILLDKSIFDAIDKNKLFWKDRGFMLGNGNIWFFVDDNDKISDIYLNLHI